MTSGQKQRITINWFSRLIFFEGRKIVSMWHILILGGAIGCAIGAVVARRLLVSALWLAGASALVALMIYMLGAPEIAVVELSVGAGLVTVLFVFAISIAGEEDLDTRPVFPLPAAWGLVTLSLVLLGWLTFPRLGLQLSIPGIESFSAMIWEQRGLDVLIQIVIIFTGVLGVLGILADSEHTAHTLSQGEQPEVHP